MSELDDLEEIAEQNQHYGRSGLRRTLTKRQREALKRSSQRGAAAQLSAHKQQERALERRDELAKKANQN
jgi:hypothetical protein